MSQKCQNLLPLKINRSQSKGIGFVAEERKIEAYFPHTQIPSEARKKHQQHNGPRAEAMKEVFLAPRKFRTLCRIFMWLQFAASFAR
jgi:hypothetical protein